MAFADRNKEERFLSQYRDDTAEHLRWACLLGAAIMIGFMWQDTYISVNGHKAIYIRLFGALPVSVLAWYLSNAPGARRFISFISAFFWLSYACLTSAIFIIYEPGPYGLTSSVGVGSFLLLLFGVFAFSNLRFWESVLVGALTLLVYIVSVAFWTEADLVDFILGDFLTAVALMAGAATKTLFTDRTRRRLFETSELLRESYAMVEQQVRERTSELQVANGQLADEIAERKQIDEEKTKLQDQLLQAQKMEAVGRLAGGVAHDFNNMLTIILGRVEIAKMSIKPSDRIHADLAEIHNAGQRSADLTRQLLAFARKQIVMPGVLDLNETVEGMLKMLRRLIGEDIDVAWNPGRDLGRVNIDPSQIDQILANLCVNARDAITDVGKVTIETANTVFDKAYCAEHAGCSPGEYVMLAVRDNGCGMDKETLANVFEPFYTTKKMGKGTGLGLATVYGIVKQNDGFIDVSSDLGKGTTFTIYLPRYRGKTAQTVLKDPLKVLTGGTETILLVEDEPAISKLGKTILEKLGYVVVSANTPGEAIRLADEYCGQIHLLITDVVMPEMNGRDLSDTLMSRYPLLKCLFMSGYTADVIAHHGVLDEGVHFIQKPFSIQHFSFKVREALELNEAG